MWRPRPGLEGREFGLQSNESGVTLSWAMKSEMPLLREFPIHRSPMNKSIIASIPRGDWISKTT